MSKREPNSLVDLSSIGFLCVGGGGGVATPLNNFGCKKLG